ncbi:MAG: DNA-binding protein [Coxiellaceae bacterium]|nr:MAG: DNA-binding protein [Coxiellaceae bacterium]
MKNSNIEKTKILQEFWQAPLEALFDQKTIAAVRCCSNSLLERERWAGDGIPYIKVKHKCLYRKADVVNWINQHQVKISTSQCEVSHV